MVKKFFYVFMAFLFLCAFTITTIPVYAQEEEEEVVVEDVADISLEDLLNVEITTAGRRPEKISDIPASVVLITREDIERYGYTSLKEVLENVPGVYALDDMSYYGTSFGMRGFFSQAPRNVVFLVNGVHQMDGFWKTATIRNFSIPVEAIDRIEVIRGPMSIIYGSGAFFGAINIITNMVEEGNAVNTMAASYGSMETLRLGAKFSGNVENLNYSFSAGYYDTYGPNEPLSTMTTYADVLPFFGINDTNNTTDGRMEERNKYFNLSVDYKDFYAKLSYSQHIEENYIVLPSVSDGTTTDYDLFTGSFGFKKDFTEQFNLDASVTFHAYSSWTQFDLFDPSYIEYETVRSREFEADLTASYAPSDKFNLTAGLHYQEVMRLDAFDIVPPFPYNVHYLLPDSMQTPSLFVQTDFSLFKGMRLVAGVRLERLNKYTLEGFELNLIDGTKTEVASGQYENNEVQVIPRVAVIFSLNDKNYIKLLYGKAIRQPEFQPNLENLIFGGATLTPEYINTFEFNYIATPSSGFTVNLSLFYNQLKSLIARRLAFVGGELVSIYGNGGELETIGGELSVMAKPIENFTLDLSGTYQKTKDKTEGFEDIDVAYSPNLIAHLKASYKFGENVIFAVVARYVDEMEPAWDVVEDARIGQKVDSHFILDSSIRIMFGDGYFLSIKGTNLFDTEYLYPTNINNNLWADLGTIGRGLSRTFMVTLGKKW